MKKRSPEAIHETRESAFHDIDLPDSEELQAKSALVFRIARILDGRKLTQSRAAKLLGIDQPKISALLRGRLDGFSTERLFRFLNALDQDIEIIVKPRPRSSKRTAEVRVLAA